MSETASETGAPSTTGIVFNPNQPDRDTYMRLREMDQEIGWLGKVFGSSENAPIYIVGTVAILLVVAGGVASIVSKDKAGAEVWAVLAAPITGILGYLFGKGQSKT